VLAAPAVRLEIPNEYAAVAGAERHLLAGGGESQRPDRQEILPFDQRRDGVNDVAAAAFQDGDGGVERAESADGDVLIFLVRRQGEGVDGAALLAPDAPAQHGRVGGAQFALNDVPDADDLVVADREQLFAVGGEREVIARPHAAAALDDEFRVLPVAAVDLGVGRQHR
jgi:hypothetical protein